MGWAIGTNSEGRDIAYGVPSLCDHPDCNQQIDRGLENCCGDYFDKKGCGLYFCSTHRHHSENREADLCKRCYHGNKPYQPKPDIPLWVWWKLTHESWQQWRDENPEKIKTMQEFLDKLPAEVLKEAKEKVEEEIRLDQ